MITIADSLAISTRLRPYRSSLRLLQPLPPPPSDSFYFPLLKALLLASMFPLAKFIASNSRVFWGWLFLIVGSLSFMGFLYAAVISKIQPPSHNLIIHAIQNDWYYCFLVPLTVPILFVAVYFHWLSMKLFKHA